MTIVGAHEKLKAKAFSSLELTKACIEQIEKHDSAINAVVHRIFDRALEEAKKVDSEGKFDHPLTGIPYLTKDVYCEEGVPTTACSNVLRNPTSLRSPTSPTCDGLRGAGAELPTSLFELRGTSRGAGKDYVPPFDSTTTKRLKAVGAISLGKTNTDEFTMGASTETSCFGVTRNPWDTSRVAGGSSGGSAAGTAADMCVFALGTDTGGSIRQPAGFCSVSGIRVTYGRTSRYGVMSMASSLDTIGSFAKTAQDLAIILETIAGKDPLDATTGERPVPDYRASLNGNVQGLRIGLPREYFIAGVHPEVESAVRGAADVLQRQGATIREISLPHTKYAVATYYVICPSEVSSNMSRYDGIRYGHSVDSPEDLLDYYRRVRSEGFGAEVKRRIMIGTYALSAGYYDAYYRQAQKVRTLIKRDFEEAFQEVDVILSPVSPTPAFTIGQHEGDPVAAYLEDIFTVSQAMAGIPALSIPCGFARAKPSSAAPRGAKEDGILLPIGLQIMGPQWGEERILRVADALQRVTDWHTKKPMLS